MALYDDIKKIYPELLDNDFNFINGAINLRNDSDGKGDFIEKWEYEKPIPAGMKLGK
jgi:hypothetical protein